MSGGAGDLKCPIVVVSDPHHGINTFDRCYHDSISNKNGLVKKSFCSVWAFIWCRCAHFCGNIYSGFRTFLINFTSIRGVYRKLQWFV